MNQIKRSAPAFASIEPAPNAVKPGGEIPAFPFCERDHFLIVLRVVRSKHVDWITPPIDSRPPVDQTVVLGDPKAALRSAIPSWVRCEDIRRTATDDPNLVAGRVGDIYSDPNRRDGVADAQKRRRDLCPYAESNIGIRADYVAAAEQKSERRDDEDTHVFSVRKKRAGRLNDQDLLANCFS